MDLAKFDMLNLDQKATTSNERNALISFYNYLNGQIWENSNNWLDGDPCLVIFISCILLELLVWSIV
jgi:hypothetical protein